MPCAPLPREAGPRWTVFGIRAYHVDEVLEGLLRLALEIPRKALTLYGAGAFSVFTPVIC